MKKSLGNGANLFPMPVLMIATYNDDGTVDVMNMAWGGICDDHKVALNLAPDHRTSANIKQRKAFTISVADAAHIVESDYLGIASGNDVKDKFQVCGLTAVKSEKVDAPVVTEYPITLECEVVDMQEDPGLLHVVGEIKDTLVDESILNEKGRVDVRKLDALIFSTFDHTYYRVGEAVGGAFKAGVPLLKK